MHSLVFMAFGNVDATFMAQVYFEGVDLGEGPRGDMHPLDWCSEWNTFRIYHLHLAMKPK